MVAGIPHPESGDRQVAPPAQIPAAAGQHWGGGGLDGFQFDLDLDDVFPGVLDLWWIIVSFFLLVAGLSALFVWAMFTIFG